MTDDQNPIINEIEALAERIFSTMGESPFADTLGMLTNILVEQAGVSNEDIAHLAGHVPEVVSQAASQTDAFVEARMRTALYDVVFIGLLFNQYRDTFIERVESGLSGEAGEQ